jgi:hypothetical protein
MSSVEQQRLPIGLGGSPLSHGGLCDAAAVAVCHGRHALRRPSWRRPPHMFGRVRRSWRNAFYKNAHWRVRSTPEHLQEFHGDQHRSLSSTRSPVVFSH